MAKSLKTINEILKEMLNKHFGDIFKFYYDGDPLFIPQQNLPCIIIETDSETPSSDATGIDKLTTEVTVKLVVNKKDDYGKSPDTVMWRKRLQKMVSDRDRTTRQYKDKTVFGLLRVNLTLDDRFTSSVPVVKYGVVPRPQDLITEEAHIELSVQETVPVPSRT